MEPGLNGTVALNTGASGGISAGIASELARESVNVCLAARGLTKLNQIAATVHTTANVRTAVHRADWRHGFALRYHRHARLTRAAWPYSRAVKGNIVNIVGIGSRSGSAEFTIGGSVNAAILNFTEAMADIGVKDGARVNAINPGQIETRRFGQNVERTMLNGSREEAITYLVSSHGTTRVGQPDEGGALTAFLASDKPDFIQGSIIGIDGGVTRSL